MKERTDTERLEWLVRHMTGWELRRLLGILPDAGRAAEVSRRIDDAIGAEEGE